MVLNLASRTYCDLHEAGKVGIAASAAAFGYLGCNGNAGTPELTGHIPLRLREIDARLVEGQHQLVGFPPNLQIVEIAHTNCCLGSRDIEALHAILFLMGPPRRIRRTDMERFLKRHEGHLKGIISGFDRILFRGTLRTISHSKGIEQWLWSEGVPLTQFGPFAQKVSNRLKGHAKAIADKQGRPFQHIFSPKADKDKLVRQIIAKDQVRKGLVCVLSCVEPSQTFLLYKNRAAKILQLVSRERPCLHLYFYFLDREFGLMHDLVILTRICIRR